MVFLGNYNKAPGPHGFTLEFPQKNWDIIKGSVINHFDKFCWKKLDVRRPNYGTSTTVPIKPGVDTIKSFTPICFLNA